MQLTDLSDDELLSSLDHVCFEMHRLLGRLLLHLIEVEARRLDVSSAYGSLFDFCIRRLGMSESEACRRIEAARLVKRFPCLLEAIERGDLHLTGLLLLRPHFTSDNVAELVVAARGKTKREIQELIAARAPKPDVLPTITALAVEPRLTPPLPTQEKPAATLEPLSPTRHRLELTVSSDVRAMLERARDLRGGSLEDVLAAALGALLAKLEKDRPGKGFPAEVRREVFARDGERCTFTDEAGHRCESRAHLEIDHRKPRARGGSNEASNLRVVCRAHNLVLAEREFGREHVRRQIHLRQRRKEDVDPTAARARTNLGFRDRDVRLALEALPSGLSMPEVIRQALRRLSP